jgi:hypothetical protein
MATDALAATLRAGELVDQLRLFVVEAKAGLMTLSSCRAALRALAELQRRRESAGRDRCLRGHPTH